MGSKEITTKVNKIKEIAGKMESKEITSQGELGLGIAAERGVGGIDMDVLEDAIALKRRARTVAF